MKFADIPDHLQTKARLRDLVDSDRIPHALLLEGPTGSAKFALARALAQYIHCEHRTPDGDSCGSCPSCKQHQSFNHIDTIFSFPIVKKRDSGLSEDFLPEFRDYLKQYPFMDFEKWLEFLDNVNAKPQIYVDEANSLIQKLNFTSHNSKYKIVLMWLPERMREDTANKLLKLIEEPYPDTLFILTSDNPQNILPTIYSRTQRVAVKRYDASTLADYLATVYPVDAQAAQETARLAEGNISKAVKLISVSNDNALFLDMMMQLMRKAYTRKVKELKEWSVELAKLGREQQMRFYDYCARMMRENFILNLNIPQLNFLNPDEAGFSSKFHPFINAKNVEQLYRVFFDARTDLSFNGNAKIINFDVAIKVILLLK